MWTLSGGVNTPVSTRINVSSAVTTLNSVAFTIGVPMRLGPFSPAVKRLLAIPRCCTEERCAAPSMEEIWDMVWAPPFDAICADMRIAH